MHSKKNNNVGAWRSLVAHLHGVQGVPSSNLGAPTSLKSVFRLRRLVPFLVPLGRIAKNRRRRAESGPEFVCVGTCAGGRGRGRGSGGVMAAGFLGARVWEPAAGKLEAVRFGAFRDQEQYGIRRRCRGQRRSGKPAPQLHWHDRTIGPSASVAGYVGYCQRIETEGLPTD